MRVCSKTLSPSGPTPLAETLARSLLPHAHTPLPVGAGPVLLATLSLRNVFHIVKFTMSSEGGEGDERVVKRSVDSDNAPTDTTKSANRKKTKVDAPAAADPEAKTTQDDDEEEVEVAFDSLIRTENESVRRRQQPGVDLFAVPDYQGTPITEVNIDQLDDKPWTKPGADISDWFNYGFNEGTSLFLS